MRTQLITYDLFRPGQDYADLIARTKALGAWCHPLLSVWIVRTNSSAAAVRDALAVAPLIDAGDKLLVVDVTGGATAWTTSLGNEISQWLKLNMPLVA